MEVGKEVFPLSDREVTLTPFEPIVQRNKKRTREALLSTTGDYK